MAAGVFAAEGLDLLEVENLDTPVVAPSTEDGGGRGDTGSRSILGKGVHTDDSFEVRQLVRHLQQRCDMVAYYCHCFCTCLEGLGVSTKMRGREGRIQPNVPRCRACRV